MDTLRIWTDREHLATLWIDDGFLYASGVAPVYERQVARWKAYGFTEWPPNGESPVTLTPEEPGFLAALEAYIQRTTAFHKTKLTEEP